MTGRYKAYPEYKDSGVEWVGKIPSHWGLKKLKYLAPLISEKAKGKTNPIALEHIQSWTGKLISTDSKFDGDGTKFKAGDILFGKLRPYLAKVYLTEEDGEAIGDFHVMRPINSSYGKFLKSLMLTTDYISTVDASTYGAKMPRASWDFTSNIQLPFCSETEAEKITNFLDHETAKIDTLIAKQEMLIELLKEKRQAVISHAVTKGLNSDAPMKNSGVEWLGEVPEHWDRSRLGFECSVKARLGWKGLKADEYVPEGYIFLATPNIKGSEIDFENVNYITKQRYDESPEIMLQEKDLLVTKDGSTTGTTNLVRKLPAPATVNSSIAVIRSRGNILPEYLYYFFVSTYTQNVIKRMQGGMGVPHLFQADLRWFHILLPSNVEQESIAKYLDTQTAKCDLLIEKATNAIQLMKERKIALISAAVTGKIDVRHFVVEQGQPQGVQG
ncbi:restriction endonuclease subunit S [Vibrio cholerae]